MRHSMAQRHICLVSKVMDSKATAGPCFNKLFAVTRCSCLGAGSPSVGNNFAFLHTVLMLLKPIKGNLSASLNPSYKRSMQYCMNMVWHEETIQLYLGKPLAGATSLRVVLSNSLKHMNCQRFLTPAGSGFRKAKADWNLLSHVRLDLGSARGLLQLQRRGA